MKHTVQWYIMSALKHHLHHCAHHTHMLKPCYQMHNVVHKHFPPPQKKVFLWGNFLHTKIHFPAGGKIFLGTQNFGASKAYMLRKEQKNAHEKPKWFLGNQKMGKTAKSITDRWIFTRDKAISTTHYTKLDTQETFSRRRENVSAACFFGIRETNSSIGMWFNLGCVIHRQQVRAGQRVIQRRKNWETETDNSVFEVSLHT